MRILLVGNYLADKQQSMLRFADLMRDELGRRGHSVSLLHPGVRLGAALAGSRWSKWFGYVDKFLLFPWELRRRKTEFDVVHILDHSNAMYVRHLADRPCVVTCHDLLAVKSARSETVNQVSSTGRIFQNWILAGLKQARYIVCVSGATQTDLLRLAERPVSGSEVVYLSLNYPYRPMQRDEALSRLRTLGYDVADPFYVHVGGPLWYKNKPGLLRIFAEVRKRPGAANLRLILVGEALTPDLEAEANRLGITECITVLSGISNEDLRAVYSLALGLIFPSLEEGYGWPVLEAQACGCPVFATGRAPMTEIGGDAAMYFDLADVEGAAAVVGANMEHAGRMRERGVAHAAEFSVERMIAGYVAAYEKVRGT